MIYHHVVFIPDYASLSFCYCIVIAFLQTLNCPYYSISQNNSSELNLTTIKTSQTTSMYSIKI